LRTWELTWIETHDRHDRAHAVTDAALNVVSFLSLGFFLGMRHATDADHVVAIATIISRERTMKGSALIGAAWGIGHTLTVLAVGVAIIGFGMVIPPRLGLSMEFAVGIMLVVLGVLTLTGMGRAVGILASAGARGRHALDVHDHVHAHGDYVHSHPHGLEPDAHGHAEHQTPLARLDRSRLGRLGVYQWVRPFVVGLVHGLAGSAAIALMVLSVIRDMGAAMGYLLLFGLGTVAGMMLITLALSAPFAFTAVNLPKFNWRLRVASGLISFAFGVALIYGTGFASGGLFTDAPSWTPH
jgi:high-affinity nickel-transport protein